MAVFETSVTLSCPADRAFDFLIVPQNHLKLSPPEVGLVFVQAPAVFEQGSRFDFKVLSFGLVQHMQHEIIAFERPWQFTERQLKGPLKLWQHDHVFELQPDGQVTITDRIEFEPPGGLAGLLITENRIRDSLEDGFYHRHKELRKLLEIPA